MTDKNKKPRHLRLLYIALQLGEDKRPIRHDAIGAGRGMSDKIQEGKEVKTCRI